MSYKEGCIIVLFNDGVSENQALQLIQSFGLSLKETRNWRGMATVAVPVGQELDWVGEFRKQNIVKIAELSIIHHLS